VVIRNAGHLADVLVHRQFFIEKNAKVTHSTDWLKCTERSMRSIWRCLIIDPNQISSVLAGSAASALMHTNHDLLDAAL